MPNVKVLQRINEKQLHFCKVGPITKQKVDFACNLLWKFNDDSAPNLS